MANQIQTRGIDATAQSGQGNKGYPWGCLSVSLLLMTAASIIVCYWIWNAFNFSILSLAEQVAILTLFVTAGCVILQIFFGMAQLVVAAALPQPLHRKLHTMDQWIWNHFKPLRPLIRFLQNTFPFIRKQHFCISYHVLDRAWAKWISLQLEQAGHSTTLRDWNGGNLEDEIKKANRRGEYTITVLSPDYLRALKTGKSKSPKEKGRGYREENKNELLFKRWNLPQKRGIPVRVHQCDLEEDLAEIQPINLVGKEVEDKESMARERLLKDLPISHDPQYKPSISADEAKKIVFPGKFPYIKYRKSDRNRLFTGRNTFLEDLHYKFKEASIQAVYGLKGIGKTQTALEYAYRYEGYYHTIIWLDASTQEKLEADCYTAVQVIRREAYKEAQEQDDDLKQVVQTSPVGISWLKSWLENHFDWLVILDRCDLNLLQAIIPLEAKGHVLLTMEGPPRQQVQIISPVGLSGMEDNEGGEFLLRVIKGSPGITPINEKHYDLARQISHSMRGLPLGILHAGSYIATTNDLAGYLDLYRNRRADLLQQRPNFVFLEPEFQTIATTWSISFEKLDDNNPSASELLRFCAYLAPDPIPEKIFREAPEATLMSERLKDIRRNEIDFNNAIDALNRFSLIRRVEYISPMGPDVSYNLVVHPLVQDVIREGIYAHNGAITDEMQRLYAKRALLAVENVFRAHDVKYEKWELCQRYLPHALICIKYIERWNFESKEVQRLLYVTGRYLYTQGEYSQASPILESAMLLGWKFAKQYADSDWETYRNALADLTIYLDALAELYQAQTLYERAESLYQLAFAIRLIDPRRGPQHQDTATSLNNLGKLYDDWGQYHQDQLELIAAQFYRDWKEHNRGVEGLYRLALRIRRSRLGPEHIDVAISLNNLASYYYKQGELYRLNGSSNKATEMYKKAEENYKLALYICKKLPPGHPDLLLSKANVATIEFTLGQQAKAEVDLVNAIEITKKFHGNNHPQVAARLNNLAEVYRRRNKEQVNLPWRRRSRRWYNLAEENYQQAYAIYRQQLVPEHPSIQIVVHNYATLLREEDSIQNKPKQKDYVRLARKKLEKYTSERAA